MLAKLLALLAERDRLVVLPDLLAAYRERLLEHQRRRFAPRSRPRRRCPPSAPSRSSSAWRR